MGSLKEALSYGANTFMFYTGAPQNTSRYPINDEITYKALELMNKENIDIGLIENLNLGLNKLAVENYQKNIISKR